MKLSTCPPTPIKPQSRSAADQIETPEQPPQLSQRARNRRVAISVKQVRKVAFGLQTALRTNPHDGDDDDDLDHDDNDLSSVEAQISVGPALARKPKLREKYEILGEFFNSMVSSIQLLQLRRSMSTFSNICTSIQHLTDRRFTYGNLAQLKYILPEAILIKKVLVHDGATCCMKPELHVILQEAICGGVKQNGENGHFGLRKIFRERLESFSKEHPEVMLSLM